MFEFTVHENRNSQYKILYEDRTNKIPIGTLQHNVPKSHIKFTVKNKTDLIIIITTNTILIWTTRKNHECESQFIYFVKFESEKPNLSDFPRMPKDRTWKNSLPHMPSNKRADICVLNFTCTYSGWRKSLSDPKSKVLSIFSIFSLWHFRRNLTEYKDSARTE